MTSFFALTLDFFLLWSDWNGSFHPWGDRWDFSIGKMCFWFSFLGCFSLCYTNEKGWERIERKERTCAEGLWKCHFGTLLILYSLGDFFIFSKKTIFSGHTLFTVWMKPILSISPYWSDSMDSTDRTCQLGQPVDCSKKLESSQTKVLIDL